MKRLFPTKMFVALAVVSVTIAACSGAESPTAPPTGSDPVQNATVTLMPNNTFSPATVNLAAGGTVTFTNSGGFHNVTANDGSFRCSNGCDGQGGNGNPSTNAWSVTITFPDSGAVGYSCEVHGGVGMRGTINVQ